MKNEMDNLVDFVSTKNIGKFRSGESIPNKAIASTGQPVLGQPNPVALNVLSP